MKTFKDLQFQEYDYSICTNDKKSIARLFFPNGYGISVVLSGSGDIYSNGIDSYEVAVLRGTIANFMLCYDTPITDGVLGWQSEDDVNDIMKRIQELK